MVLVGWFMLAAFLAGLVLITARAIGWRGAAFCWGFAVGGTAVVVVAALMIAGEIK